MLNKSRIFLVRKIGDKYVLFCSKCGEKAAYFHLKRNSEQEITSIRYSGNYLEIIEECFTNKIHNLLKEKDIDELDQFLSYHNIIQGGVDVYCNKCGKVYCPECWNIHLKFEADGWYDETIGICPEQHKKIIDD
ncbi:MAG: hypothetical protein P8Y70_15990 [Candidatus Lokiarchaeota archaeon]